MWCSSRFSSRFLLPLFFSRGGFFWFFLIPCFSFRCVLVVFVFVTYSLVMKLMYSETHSWTVSLASLAILALEGRARFIIRLMLAMGRNRSCSLTNPLSSSSLPPSPDPSGLPGTTLMLLLPLWSPCNRVRTCARTRVRHGPSSFVSHLDSNRSFPFESDPNFPFHRTPLPSTLWVRTRVPLRPNRSHRRRWIASDRCQGTR